MKYGDSIYKGDVREGKELNGGSVASLRAIKDASAEADVISNLLRGLKTYASTGEADADSKALL